MGSCCGYPNDHSTELWGYVHSCTALKTKTSEEQVIKSSAGIYVPPNAGETLVSVVRRLLNTSSTGLGGSNPAHWDFWINPGPGLSFHRSGICTKPSAREQKRIITKAQLVSLNIGVVSTCYALKCVKPSHNMVHVDRSYKYVGIRAVFLMIPLR